MREVVTRIEELSETTVRQLGVVMDQLLECQLYGEVASLRQLILDNRNPMLDGKLDEVMAHAGSVSGRTYKDLNQVAERLDAVGLSVQANLLRDIAEGHKEMSMLTSEDTNPLGLRLPDR